MASQEILTDIEFAQSQDMHRGGAPGWARRDLGGENVWLCFGSPGGMLSMDRHGGRFESQWQCASTSTLWSFACGSRHRGYRADSLALGRLFRRGRGRLRGFWAVTSELVKTIVPTHLALGR